MYFIALQGPRTHNFIVHVWCTEFALAVLRVHVLNTNLAIYSNPARINQTRHGRTPALYELAVEITESLKKVLPAKH